MRVLAVALALVLGAEARADTAPAGHLAVPASGQGQGVLVLHPWWGLNDTIKSFCDRLAGEGFVAFAPDLYDGKVATTIPEAEALVNALDEAKAMTQVGAAATYLEGRARPGGIGVIGFSMGAGLALPYSKNDPERVRAVVVFYGTRRADYARSKAAYLGHFAQSDEFEPKAEVDTLKIALRAAGRPVTFHTYKGTGHWFFEPDRVDAYDEKSAKKAWERTVAFLKERL
jgi:carboxymethylenebutenolidase